MWGHNVFPHLYFLRRLGLGGFLRRVIGGLDGAVLRLVVRARAARLAGILTIASFWSDGSIFLNIITRLRPIDV